MRASLSINSFKIYIKCGFILFCNVLAYCRRACAQKQVFIVGSFAYISAAIPISASLISCVCMCIRAVQSDAMPAVLQANANNHCNSVFCYEFF